MNNTVTVNLSPCDVTLTLAQIQIRDIGGGANVGKHVAKDDLEI